MEWGRLPLPALANMLAYLSDWDCTQHVSRVCKHWLRAVQARENALRVHGYTRVCAQRQAVWVVVHHVLQDSLWSKVLRKCLPAPCAKRAFSHTIHQLGGPEAIMAKVWPAYFGNPERERDFGQPLLGQVFDTDCHTWSSFKRTTFFATPACVFDLFGRCIFREVAPALGTMVMGRNVISWSECFDLLRQGLLDNHGIIAPPLGKIAQDMYDESQKRQAKKKLRLNEDDDGET